MGALVVVGEPSHTGGRRVSVMSRGCEEPLGTAFSDHDVVVFLQAAGLLSDPDEVLDHPRWVQGRGGRG
ncbi:hypothetical protein [Streptomyces chryseus]